MARRKTRAELDVEKATYEADEAERSSEPDYDMIADTPEEEVATSVEPEFEMNTPHIVSEPERELPLVGLRVFCAVSGYKWDQMAGFQHYAREMPSRTIPEWREEHQKFLNKPTG